MLCATNKQAWNYIIQVVFIVWMDFVEMKYRNV